MILKTLYKTTSTGFNYYLYQDMEQKEDGSYKPTYLLIRKIETGEENLNFIDNAWAEFETTNIPYDPYLIYEDDE